MNILRFSQSVAFCVYSLVVFLSVAENKPIWMHAEEREEMSKVRGFLIIILTSFSTKAQQARTF